MNRPRFITFAAIALMALTATAQEVNKSLEFTPTIHDFGTIEEMGGKVSHRFKVTNIGTEPQSLISAMAGCVCVRGEVPKEPIKPGKSAWVTVTFDPEYRPGHFSKEVVVRSGNNRFNRIWVKGDVNPGKHPVQATCRYDFGSGLFLNFERMSFGHLTPCKPSSQTLAFGNDTDRPMDIKFEIRKNDPNILIAIGRFTAPAPGEVNKVKITVMAYRSFGGQATAQITPIVDGKRLAPLDLRLTCSNE